MQIHLIEVPIQWLTDPFWAKVLIIFAITWRWTGYNMIFFISGMQNIDPSIYEAAEIDGATKWDQLFKITILICGQSFYSRQLLQRSEHCNYLTKYKILQVGTCQCNHHALAVHL